MVVDNFDKEFNFNHKNIEGDLDTVSFDKITNSFRENNAERQSQTRNCFMTSTQTKRHCIGGIGNFGDAAALETFKNDWQS